MRHTCRVSVPLFSVDIRLEPAGLMVDRGFSAARSGCRNRFRARAVQPSAVVPFPAHSEALILEAKVRRDIASEIRQVRSLSGRPSVAELRDQPSADA